ncbi:MAG: alpha-galactosidase [Spirochaetales bacterium]|uniref:alpha-galactosidase n=1 Tax=Candidatus Thalassospirochaeta sargassi TaxID=3119039 RepID=A0AAJ1IF48_9SPIO|nr:alpha-galactosidase [Spirochaetales bacterium]
MIRISSDNREFYLATAGSSYIIRILDSGHPVNLYYGRRIKHRNCFDSLYQAYSLDTGSSTGYSVETDTLNLDNSCLEAPGYGKGDYREPSIEVQIKDGSRTCDFIYKSHRSYKGENKLEGLPYVFQHGDDAESFELVLEDAVIGAELVLSYTVFYERDVIARSAKLINNSSSPLKLEKLMSFNLDFPEAEFELISLDGKWIRERRINRRSLSEGIFKIDSKKGVSSANHNPFLCLMRPATDEHKGDCYGFSLLYSGNHLALAEVNPHYFTRIQMGVNPFDFSWLLESGQSFQSPQAVLTFSSDGLNGMSSNMHSLVKNNIVNPAWQNRERPVLINNWEATYFNFDEKKLLKLADEAVKLGIELFVLDDGWFGRRNDDHSSLGDWFDNRKKLPGGLERLSDKIHSRGLQFGLWVEPEMINADSELYHAHPEWVIKTPGRPASEGRHQLMLDLANPEVVDFLFTTFSALFRRANLQYVKWDHNRNMSDVYSNVLPAERQKETAHRNVLGLYKLLEKLKNDFPDILFESCASGGNRYDLGMLYYMPQAWTSDDTDALERIDIQYGTSMLYPPSTMGAHVSASPSHQVLRNTPIETRFNVAAFGLLGYELDLTRLSNFDRKAIKKQVSYYKEHRALFQFGRFYRLSSPFESNNPMWMLVGEDGSEAMLGCYQKLQKPSPGFEQFRMKGLNPDMLYQLEERRQYFNIKDFGELVNHVSPIKMKADSLVHNLVSDNYMFAAEIEKREIFGDELMYAGFRPAHQFMGTAFSDQTRLMGDYGSRIYYLKNKPTEKMEK